MAEKIPPPRRDTPANSTSTSDIGFRMSNNASETNFKTLLADGTANGDVVVDIGVAKDTNFH